MSEKPVIHVVRIPHGSWEVQRENGETIARYSSEFQAWDAGRAAAESAGADLVIHQLDGAPRFESFDPKTGTLQPAEDNGFHGAGAPAPSSEDRKLILLVEDMVDARELYADYLAYAGFSVVTAINGHEAIGLARLLRPDLILMDIRLPGMDGLEATADIKADPDLAHIPVVAITADSSNDINTRARRAGCAGVITKPVLPDEVARKITTLLATAQPQRSTS
jgi:two-component system cell cycle response regulator DivK